MSINSLTDKQRLEIINNTRKQMKAQTVTPDFKSDLENLILIATQELYLRKSLEAKKFIREELHKNIEKIWKDKNPKQMIDCLVMVNEKMQAFGIQISKIEKMVGNSTYDGLLDEVHKFQSMMFDQPEKKEETE